MKPEALIEKRSHPDLNGKTTPLDELRALVDQHGDDIYVSFTQGFGKNASPKLGINPRSSFETPLGIYCYRARVVIQHTEMELDNVTLYGDDNGGLSAPFTGDHGWHNAWVFTLDDAAALRAPLRGYFHAIEKLKSFWDGDDAGFLQLIEVAEDEAIEKTHIWYFWNATRIMARHLAKSPRARISMWNKILRGCGFTMAEDRGEGWIHENETEQCVVLDPRIVRPITIIKRSEAAARLHYGLRQRATQDPQLLTKLPHGAVNRLGAPIASQLIDNYLDADGDIERAMQFVDALSPEVRPRVCPFLANSIHLPQSLVGWHGTLATRAYLAINRQGVHNLVFNTMERIDVKLAEQIAKLFFYDAAMKTPGSQHDWMAEAVIHLLREPNRFDNFQDFVGRFSRGQKMNIPERYHEACVLAGKLKK